MEDPTSGGTSRSATAERSSLMAQPFELVRRSSRMKSTAALAQEVGFLAMHQQFVLLAVVIACLFAGGGGKRQDEVVATVLSFLVLAVFVQAAALAIVHGARQVVARAKAEARWAVSCEIALSGFGLCLLYFTVSLLLLVPLAWVNRERGSGILLVAIPAQAWMMTACMLLDELGLRGRAVFLGLVPALIVLILAPTLELGTGSPFGSMYAFTAAMWASVLVSVLFLSGALDRLEASLTSLASAACEKVRSVPIWRRSSAVAASSSTMVADTGDEYVQHITPQAAGTEQSRSALGARKAKGLSTTASTAFGFGSPTHRGVESGYPDDDQAALAGRPRLIIPSSSDDAAGAISIMHAGAGTNVSAAPSSTSRRDVASTLRSTGAESWGGKPTQAAITQPHEVLDMALVGASWRAMVSREFWRDMAVEGYPFATHRLIVWITLLLLGLIGATTDPVVGFAQAVVSLALVVILEAPLVLAVVLAARLRTWSAATFAWQEEAVREWRAARLWSLLYCTGVVVFLLIALPAWPSAVGESMFFFILLALALCWEASVIGGLSGSGHMRQGETVSALCHLGIAVPLAYGLAASHGLGGILGGCFLGVCVSAIANEFLLKVKSTSGEAGSGVGLSSVAESM